MHTIESPDRERDLRERLLEFTDKLRQALALAQDMERRAGTARNEGASPDVPQVREK